MAIARRIGLHLSTAVKQLRQWTMASGRRIDLSGNFQWSRRGMASGRRIDVSSAMVKCPSIHSNNNRHLSTDAATNDDDYFSEIGYTDVTNLLSSPESNFLLRNNGQKVLVSSLRGKIVGLYLCEPPHGNRMQAIKKVYEEAKSRGLDFEIVQITFDFHSSQLGTYPIAEQLHEDIPWLTLPSVNSSFSKIQRIFQCGDAKHEYWAGDSLVLIYPSQFQADDCSGVYFEFSGAEILERWGIEGFPFRRPFLYKVEYEFQKREATLQSFFPPGESLLVCPRPAGDGFDLVDALSQLSGKRVLVLFATCSFGSDAAKFLSMLKSKYKGQAEESKFEVVYVLTRSSSFDVLTEKMPWLIQPFPSEAHWDRLCKVFKPYPRRSTAVAFNEQGELIAKEDCLDEKTEGYNLEFPFIDQDLEKRIRLEVEEMCNSRGTPLYLG